MERDKYYMDSAESKANKEKYLFLLFKCTLTTNGKPLFENMEEFEKCRVEKENAINILIIEFMDFINNTSDMFPNLKDKLKAEVEYK